MRREFKIRSSVKTIEKPIKYDKEIFLPWKQFFIYRDYFTLKVR